MVTVSILFPLWGRLYCLKLEQVLQTVAPDGDVALHYWDQTSDLNLSEVFPPIFFKIRMVDD